NISKELAHKIWRVTPSDLALGIPEPTLATTPYIGGVDWGSYSEPGSGVDLNTTVSSNIIAKQPANGKASPFINEVERTLFGDSTGYPDHGTINYYKAAENYSLSGDTFLDFPKDTTSCFAGLGPMMSQCFHPPPGFERPGRSAALYERRQASILGGAATPVNYIGVIMNKLVIPGGYNILSHHQQHQQIRQRLHPQQQRQLITDCSNNHNNRNASSNFNDIQISQFHNQIFSQLPPQAQQQLQYQQQRVGVAPGGSGELGGGGHNSDIGFAQFYQQWVARNLRNSQLHQQHHPQHQQQQQQQTNTSAAAAAMLYANLEFHQQVQLRQLLHQQHQQQQQQARLTRGIYGGSAGTDVPPNGNEQPASSYK
ncbi:hypothetical protein KR018_002324, partial [Drosophila ironensis]